MVPLQGLDFLELERNEGVQEVSQPGNTDRSRTNGDNTDLVSIPVFHHLVFANCPKVMGLFLKRDLHNRFIVREYGFVTVTKIETPDLNVLVGRTCHDQFGIV